MKILLLIIILFCCSCSGLNKQETKAIRECLQENRQDFYDLRKAPDTDLRWKARDLKLARAIELCKESEK